MITVKPVSGRGDLRRFIAFPNRLFKDVPSYIPALNFDERNLLTDRNPSLEHCSRELYLAWRDGKVVGRVAAIINRTVNEHWNKKAVRFGWFDFVEDYDVFTALLDKVVEYGREHGMDEIEGPFGFTDMDKECWVIDNFDARQNISTLYNPEYYVRFIERAGYEIKCRWQQYSMPANQPVPDKVARLNKLIMEKYNLHLVKVKRRKDIYPHAYKFFEAINSSFKDLYDFVPMTEKEIEVDTICLAVGLAPLSELVTHTRCKMRYIPQLGGFVPERDENLETTAKGFYVAGDVSCIEEATAAMIEGSIAGLSAAIATGMNHPDTIAKRDEWIEQLKVLRSGKTGAKIRSGFEIMNGGK